MQAAVGDRLVITGRRVGEPDRAGEILEVKGADGAPPYVVRWEADGRISHVFPGSDTTVEHSGQPRHGSPEHPNPAVHLGWG